MHRSIPSRVAVLINQKRLMFFCCALVLVKTSPCRHSPLQTSISGCLKQLSVIGFSITYYPSFLAPASQALPASSTSTSPDAAPCACNDPENHVGFRDLSPTHHPATTSQLLTGPRGQCRLCVAHLEPLLHVFSDINTEFLNSPYASQTVTQKVARGVSAM